MSTQQHIQYAHLMLDEEFEDWIVHVETYEGLEYIHKQSMNQQQAERLYNRVLDADTINVGHWNKIHPCVKHAFQRIA